jgi:hypothetical protein
VLQIPEEFYLYKDKDKRFGNQNAQNITKKYVHVVQRKNIKHQKEFSES